MSLGVPAGATTPYHWSASKSLSPDSATVGRSGKASSRFGLDTANEVSERMTALGGEVIPASAEQFGALIHSERLRYENWFAKPGSSPTESVLAARCHRAAAFDVAEVDTPFAQVIGRQFQ